MLKIIQYFFSPTNGHCLRRIHSRGTHLCIIQLSRQSSGIPFCGNWNLRQRYSFVRNIDRLQQPLALLNSLSNVYPYRSFAFLTLLLQVLQLPIHADTPCRLAYGTIEVPISIVIYILRKVINIRIRTRN